MYAFGVDPFRKINQDLNLSSKSTEWHIPQGIQATGSPLLEAALCQPLHSLADSDQSPEHKIFISNNMLCWPLMSCTTSKGNKETFAFLPSRIILFSAAPSKIHSVPAAGPEQCLGDNAQLCHTEQVPTCTGCLRKESPWRWLPQDWIFFLFRNAAIIFVNTAGRWSVGQVPASWNAAWNAAPRVPTALYLFHHILKDTGLAPQKSITLLVKYIH